MEPFGSDYAHTCKLRCIPMERLRAKPFVMNIIKVPHALRLRQRHTERAGLLPASAHHVLRTTHMHYLNEENGTCSEADLQDLAAVHAAMAADDDTRYPHAQACEELGF